MRYDNMSVDKARNLLKVGILLEIMYVDGVTNVYGLNSNGSWYKRYYGFDNKQTYMTAPMSHARMRALKFGSLRRLL